MIVKAPGFTVLATLALALGISLAAYDQTTLNTPAGSETERLRGGVATGNYFDVLGVRAQLGRTLQPSDEQPANAEIVVISAALWQRRFDSNPAVVGQTLRLNDKPYTIVGVVDQSFRGLRLGSPPEFWLPMNSTSRFVANGRRSRGVGIIGRLKPGVT